MQIVNQAKMANFLSMSTIVMPRRLAWNVTVVALSEELFFCRSALMSFTACATAPSPVSEPTSIAAR